MEVILFMSNGETLEFKQVSNFRPRKENYAYDIEFDYFGESTQQKRHLVMTGVQGYSKTTEIKSGFYIDSNNINTVGTTTIKY